MIPRLRRWERFLRESYALSARSRSGRLRGRSRPSLGSDRVAVGVLTRAFPQPLVDEMLAETGRVQERNRLLPARLGVYFVLTMCLFSARKMCPPSPAEVLDTSPPTMREPVSRS